MNDEIRKTNKIFEVISIVKSYISNQDREKIDKISSMDILDTLH